VNRRHTSILAALALIWGASFMFIKVAVRELDPAALVWLRLVLAALVLVPAALLVLGRAAVAESRARFGPLVVMGVINSALPFLLIAWAETRIDSGLTAILQATAPLFVLLISIRVGDEHINASRVAGVLVGLVGVVVLVGGGGGEGGVLAAALAVVLSALCYAAGVVFGAHALRGTEPLVIGAGSLAAASILAAPFGIATLPASAPGWKVVASVVTLGVVGTGIAYVLYFALLRGAGPSRSILVTYLVPGVAVLYGVVLLGEPLQAATLLGLVLILTGVALAVRGPGQSRRARDAVAEPRTAVTDSSVETGDPG
jgi:drug/metabolite transporter (DMT)-like permease